MRLYLLEPKGVDLDIGKGALTVDVVLGVLSRVTSGWVTRTALGSLTAFELHLVYDWARREELHVAGYGSDEDRRPRPSCLVSAALVSSLLEASTGDGESSDDLILARFRDRLAELSRLRDAPLSSAAVGSPMVGVDGDVSPAPLSPGSVPSIDYRVRIEFVLRLPPGVSPTPTSEAIDAAALAMAGPRTRSEIRRSPWSRLLRCGRRSSRSIARRGAGSTALWWTLE